MESAGQGRTAEVFFLDEHNVIKLYRPDFPFAAIGREFSSSSFVYDAGVRTPKPVSLTTMDGREGIVFQRISGPTLLSLMTTRPWKIRKLSKEMAKLHADLHSRSTPAGQLPDQKGVLTDNIQATSLLTEAEKSQILTCLEQLPRDNKICHGDLHPDNVLVDNGLWTIDWMNGMSGCPAGDAARSMLLLKFGALPEAMPDAVKVLFRYFRKVMLNSYLVEYMRLSGYAYAELDCWLLPLAAARLIESPPPEERNQLLLEIRHRLAQLNEDNLHKY